MGEASWEIVFYITFYGFQPTVVNEPLVVERLRRMRQDLWMLKMVGEAGIEPATPDLEGPCSIQLSYSPQYSRPGSGSGPQVADT
jgi:hypothetical protein